MKKFYKGFGKADQVFKKEFPSQIIKGLKQTSVQGMARYTWALQPGKEIFERENGRGLQNQGELTGK